MLIARRCVCEEMGLEDESYSYDSFPHIFTIKHVDESIWKVIKTIRDCFAYLQLTLSIKEVIHFLNLIDIKVILKQRPKCILKFRDTPNQDKTWGEGHPNTKI